jgi:hypothetical protein
MPRPQFNKLFISDDTNVFRLLGFEVMQDSHGEHYLKVVFPDLRSSAIHFQQVRTGPPGDLPLGQVDESPLQGITEFTYHYQSGVSHYKAGSTTVLEKRNLPSFQDDQPIHILRLTVFDLEAFSPYTKQRSDKDFIAATPFDGHGRVFGLYALKRPGEVTVNEMDPLLDMRSFYQSTGFADPDFALLIVDAAYRDPTGLSGWNLFTYDDPSVASRPPASPPLPEVQSTAS